MSSEVPVLLPPGTSSLPPLGGRLFAAYRISWWALAAIALSTLAWSWFDPAASFGITLLRSAKAFVLIAVSAILYRRRRTEPVAAMLALSFLLWTVSSSVDFLAASNLPALTDRIRFLFFALALLFFPDGAWTPRWVRHIGVAIVAAFVLGVAETLGMLPTSLFLPIAIGCVLAALIAMQVRYRALADGMQKLQLKWVKLGLFCGIGLILAARTAAYLTAGMPAPLVGRIFVEGLFQLGIVIVALGFLTSLLRYRLYDAEAAISRSAVYAALTLTLVGTFAASEALIELVGQRLFGMAIGNISGAVAAAIAAMMLTPLHGRISSWAEQRFQHDLAILKAELPDLLAVLSAGSSLARFCSAVLPRIEEAVHSTRMVLLVDGKLAGTQGISAASARRLLRGWTPPQRDDVRLSRNDNDPFPLRLALRCPLGRDRGWLLLGPRPDGSFYGSDDIEALTEIAPPLQRTLFSVAEREVSERSHERQQAQFRTAIGQLLERVEILEGARQAAA